MGWMFPPSGGFARFGRSPPEDANIQSAYPSANGFLLLLGSSIADDVAHDTKKVSTARAQEGINSSFAFAVAFAFAPSSPSFPLTFLLFQYPLKVGPGKTFWGILLERKCEWGGRLTSGKMKLSKLLYMIVLQTFKLSGYVY